MVGTGPEEPLGLVGTGPEEPLGLVGTGPEEPLGLVGTGPEEPLGLVGTGPYHFSYQTSKILYQLELVSLQSLMVGYCNLRPGCNTPPLSYSFFQA